MAFSTREILEDLARTSGERQRTEWDALGLRDSKAAGVGGGRGVCVACGAGTYHASRCWVCRRKRNARRRATTVRKRRPCNDCGVRTNGAKYCPTCRRKKTNSKKVPRWLARFRKARHIGNTEA